MTKVSKGLRYSKNCLRIRGRADLFIKGQVLVSFAPLPKKKTIRHTSILPAFNKDSKYYTVAFKLASVIPEADQVLQEDHNRRVKESQLEISQMCYPKPRSRHRYCGVCRGYYQDYKDHLESQCHIDHLATSQFQKLIKELSLKVQQERLSQKKEQQERVNQTLSQQQLYKCISTETLEVITAKVENLA